MADGQKQLRNDPGHGKGVLSTVAFSKSTGPAATGLLPCKQQGDVSLQGMLASLLLGCTGLQGRTQLTLNLGMSCDRCCYS